MTASHSAAATFSRNGALALADNPFMPAPTSVTPRPRSVLDGGAANSVRTDLARGGTAGVPERSTAALEQMVQSRRSDIPRVFGEADGATVKSLLAKRAAGNFSQADFAELEKVLNRGGNELQRISAFVGLLPYDDDRAAGNSMETFSPFEAMRKAGVCRDIHTLAAYFAEKAGYEVMNVGLGEHHYSHRFTMARKDGQWVKLDYGHLTPYPKDMPLDEVLQAANPGVMTFRVYSVPEGKDDKSFVQMILTTPQGAEMFEMMRGPEGLGTPGVEVRGDAGHQMARYTLRNGRTSVELHRVDRNGGPLDESVFGIARHTLGSGQNTDTISVGGGSMAGVPMRDVGDGDYSTEDMMVVFLAARGDHNLMQRDLPKLNALLAKVGLQGDSLKFDMPVKYGTQIAYVVDSEGEYQVGMSNDLSGFDAEARARLTWQRGTLELNGGVYARVNTTAMQAIREGADSFATFPLDAGVFAGGRWTNESGNFGVEAEVRHNLGDQIDERSPTTVEGLVAFDATDALGLDRGEHKVEVSAGVEVGFGGPDWLGDQRRAVGVIEYTNGRRNITGRIQGSVDEEGDVRVGAGLTIPF